MSRRPRNPAPWIVGLAVVVIAVAAVVLIRRHATASVFVAAPGSAPTSTVSAPATSTPTVPASVSPTARPSAPKPAVSTAPAVTVSAYLDGAGGRAAVAVLDRTTGRQLVVNGSERFKTASIVKIDILATLLWQDQVAGKTMTAAQKKTAVKMITMSDNTAADQLWATIGAAPALAAADKAFGLTHTTPGTTSAHPWGDTLTTAPDQLRLLRVVTEPGGPLTAASRAYILSLMAKVESGQRWGIPVAAVHASAVYVKDGWYPQPADGNRWSVNSIGRIVEPGHDFLVVTLSDHRRTESAGITVIEHAATLAVRQLRSTAR